MRGWNLNLGLLIAAVTLTFAAWFTTYRESKDFTEWDKTPHLFEGFTPDNVKIVKVSLPKKKDEAPPGPDGVVPKTPVEEKPKDPKDPKAAAASDRDEVIFVKQEDTWKIATGDLAGVPVQKGKIDTDILKHFKDIRVSKKMVHKDATDEYLKDKNLNDEAATIITCMDRNQTSLAELYLGKDAAGGKWEDVTRGYFVRNGKASRDVVVYEVDYWILAQKAEDWAEKKIHDFEQGKAIAFGLKNAHGEVTFKKDKPTDSEWKCEKPPEGCGAVKQGEVNSQLLSRFMRIDATRFIGPLAAHKSLKEFELDPAKIEVWAQLDDKKSYHLWIGKKTDKGEYYAKAEGNDFLFTVGDWVITPYDKPLKDYFDLAAPSSRPSSGASAEAATRKDGDEIKK